MKNFNSPNMRVAKLSFALTLLCTTIAIVSCNKDEESMLFAKADSINKKRDIAAIQAASRTSNQSATSNPPTVTTTPYASFTPAQKQMADPFIGYVKNLSYANLYNINALVAPFETQVINSSLSQTEKDGLLGLALATKALARFFIENGDEQIKEYLDSIGAFNASTNAAATNCQKCRTKMPNDNGGCAVNFRNVWGAAVIGLAAGGIGGGIAGVAVGTFAGAVVGAIPAGVSGAVIGGAAGFVQGAIAAVAAELLLSCGRK